MAYIERLKSGTYRATVTRTVDGERKRYTKTAPTESEVRLWAAKIEYELDLGIEQNAAPVSKKTVGEILDQYIDDRVNLLSPKTVREARGYRRTGMQGIMNVRLCKLTPRMVQQEINREAARVAPKTVRNIWGLVRAAIRAEQPAMDYHPRLPAPSHKELTIPSAKQVIALLDAAKGRRIEVPLVLAVAGGLRRGEIAALDLREDVDYENRTVTVNKSYAMDSEKNWVLKSPKNRSGYRTIRLPAWAMDVLSEVRDTYPGMMPNTITQGFDDLREKVGVNIRFHDLRHYYASVMLAAGVPDKYAMRNMGHSTIDMTKRVYQHILDSREEEAWEQIVGCLDGLRG